MKTSDIESHPLYIFTWGIIAGLILVIVSMDWPILN